MKPSLIANPGLGFGKWRPTQSSINTSPTNAISHGPYNTVAANEPYGRVAESLNALY
jgi:hypothetical protein